MPLNRGDRIGAYELIRQLGAGGMGQVWLASEPRLGRKVAVKFLPPDLTSDSERVARFEQEARSASALNHPNVCHIYAVGETDAGSQYIAMELVEGETLRAHLRRTPLPTREALNVSIQIAAALVAAHAAGIVHRDLKPENVMLRPDGLVKVLDFGLAKLTPSGVQALGEGSTQTALQSAAGTIAGTVPYMSPEQARGQPVDPRTDIWSFGVLLYEMLAGRCPFTGQTSSDILVEILDREPESLTRFHPQLPAELQRIVLKTLRKNRDERYQTMRDVELDLRALLQVADSAQSHGSASMTVSREEPQQPSVKRRKLSEWLIPLAGIRRGALVAAIVVAAIASAVVFYQWNHKTTDDRPVPDRASPTLTRLTSNPVDLPITVSVISPDGRYLAAADREGIQVRIIDTGETHRLSNTAGMTVIGWSADSTRIRAATCASELCTAWNLSLVGNSRTRSAGTWPISDFVFGLPNGVGVLRVARLGPLVVDAMDGSPPRVIERGVENFSATPDGTRLFFVREQLEIRSVPLSGGGSAAIWRSKPDSTIVDVVALADNRLVLALKRTTRDTATALWELRTDGKGGVVGEPRRLTDWRTETIANLTASSDGKRVAFALVNNQPDLYVANFNYASHALSEPRRVTSNTGDAFVTSWTPDSRAVLFASTQRGTYDIWKYDIHTNVAELFVGGPGDQWWPRLSSEGRYVFYNDHSGGSAVRLMRVPVSGGVGQIVAPVTRSTFVHCAFGKRCVLLDVGRDEILALDAVHGLGRRLGALPPATQTAGILPSGDEVAVGVAGDTGRRNRIRILSLTGGPPRELVVANAHWLVTLDGSAAGPGLFAVNVTAKGSELLFVEPDGSSRSLIKPGTFDLGAVIPSPNGEHVAFSAFTGQTDAWMLSDF